MPLNSLALRLAFAEIEEENVSCGLYRKFIRKPPEGLYPLVMPVRIGDHYNGEKSDVPFHDAGLMKCIKKFTKLLNQAFPEPPQIYLYIPAHEKPSDRIITVHGSDEQLAAQVCAALKQISYDYRNDDLDVTDIRELVAETLKEAGKRKYRFDFAPAAKNKISLHPDKIKQLYLEGACLEDTLPSSTNDEDDGIGRIKFADHLIVADFELERKATLGRLKSYLHDCLGISFLSSPHPHCIDMKGGKDDVHIAYLIGKRIAPFVNEGSAVTALQLKNAHSDARRTLETLKVEKLLVPPAARKDAAAHIRLAV